MDLTPIKPVGSLISGSTPGASDAVYPVQRIRSIPVHVIRRALCVDLSSWVARDLARWCIGRRCTHSFCASHRSRDNHDLQRAPGIITLEDVNPLVCKSQNGLSPGIDGAIPLNRGIPPLLHGKNHHLRYGARFFVDLCALQVRGQGTLPGASRIGKAVLNTFATG